MLQPLLICLALIISLPAWASDNRYLNKRVFFSQDKNKIIAVDARSARSDEFRLRLREDILAVRETQVVIIVATDQRLLAYSVRTGWTPFRLEVRETLRRIEAGDFSVFVDTSERIITFNGLTGAWFARRKSVH